MINHLIWRNLWRNKRRTLISAGSVSFSVFLAITMQSLQNGVFENLVRNMVNYYSGYMQIHRQGYWKERVLENSFAFNDSLQKVLVESGTGKSFVPRLETFLLAAKNENTKGAFLCGTDPRSEKALTRLNEKVVQGAFLDDTGDEQLVIAEGLARKLTITTGDTLTLLGQGLYGSFAAGKFRVKGIVKLGSPELNNSFVCMDLIQAQELLSAEGMLTSVSIEPPDVDMLESSVRVLQARMGRDFEIMSWKTMMPEVYYHIKMDTNSLYVVMGFLYLIIAFGVFGTILMMTNERKYEFGMLVAIGMKKFQLARMFLAEIFLMAFIGAFAGMLLSWPLVLYLQNSPLSFSGELAQAFSSYGFEPVFPAKLELSVFIRQTVNVFILSLLMSVYPLYRVVRLDPINQIKR